MVYFLFYLCVCCCFKKYSTKSIKLFFRSLELVDDDTLQYFRESAQSLIEERGAADALAAALAVISGSTKIVPRSLLSSKEVRHLFL